MKSRPSNTPSNSQVQCEVIRRELSKVVTQLRATTHQANDQKFAALVEKSTEVLEGLRKLFTRFGETATKNSDTSSGARPPAKAKDADSSKSSASSGAKSRSAEKSAAPSKGAGLPKPAAVKSEASRKPAAAPAAKVKQAVGPGPSDDASSKAATTQSPPAITPPGKPVDPDEVAAKARLQRMEARSPKMPGGHAAPKPMPPRSGKPIWAKPHSS